VCAGVCVDAGESAVHLRPREHVVGRRQRPVLRFHGHLSGAHCVIRMDRCRPGVWFLVRMGVCSGLMIRFKVR
jgi:hypothetical protein